MSGGGGGLAGPAGPANINVFNIGGANTNTEQPNTDDAKTTSTGEGEGEDGEHTGEQSGGGPKINIFKVSHEQELNDSETLKPVESIKLGKQDDGNSSGGGGKTISFK